jgi:hypothetical protein
LSGSTELAFRSRLLLRPVEDVLLGFHELGRETGAFGRVADLDREQKIVHHYQNLLVLLLHMRALNEWPAGFFLREDQHAGRAPKTAKLRQAISVYHARSGTTSTSYWACTGMVTVLLL